MGRLYFFCSLMLKKWCTSQKTMKASLVRVFDKFTLNLSQNPNEKVKFVKRLDHNKGY